MNKTLLLVLAAVLVAALAAFIFLSQQTFVVELSQADLQEHLDSGFPLKKSILIFSVNLTEPRVTLEDGSDRIRFTVNVGTNIQVEGLTPKGTGTIETSLRYSNERGELYMSKPDVALQLEGMKKETIDKMNEIANVLIREFAAKHPVYRLKEADFKQNLARAVLKDVKVEGGALKIYLGLH